MTKNDYKAARRLIRDNGRYALNWMDGNARAEMDDLLFNIQDSTDPLTERQSIVNYCNREGVAYNFRHIAN